MLIELEGVPVAALPLEAMKAQLRLGSGFGDDDVQDALVLGYLQAAIAAIEGRIGKALIARGFRFGLTCWREATGQALPLAPVRAIAALRIIDAGGVDVVIDPARYRLVADLHRPRLVPSAALLPALPRGGRAEIDFEAGFGPLWSDVPADLRQAVFLLAARYHEFRHEAEMEAGTIPFGVVGLIERWRTVRVLGGGAR
jgi:uncharacterized phiE125 gp8 family phage protein